VYQAGQAHVEAFSAALRAGGYDTRAYELNGAIDAALADASARVRFEAREAPFIRLQGFVVEEQFDDLWP
jgi:hypothetical protein